VSGEGFIKRTRREYRQNQVVSLRAADGKIAFLVALGMLWFGAHVEQTRESWAEVGFADVDDSLATL